MYFSRLKFFSSVSAPLAVGTVGSGVGVWWWFNPTNEEARVKLDEIQFDLTSSEFIRDKLTGERIWLEIQLDELGRTKKEATERLNALEEEKLTLEKNLLTETEEAIQSRKDHLNFQIKVLEGKIEEEKQLVSQINSLEEIKRNQLKEIGQLQKEIDKFLLETEKKKSELLSKSRDVSEADEDIREKVRVISGKLKAINDKNSEIEDLRKQVRQQILGLSYFYKSILLDDSQEYDFADINIQKAVFNGFESKDEYANFLIRSKDGKTVSDFKVKKTDKLFDYGNLVEKARTEGLDFKINQGTFSVWDKQFTLKLYDAGWSSNDASWFKDKESHNLDVSKIFKKEYVEEATKVLFLIEILDNTKASKIGDIWNVHNNGWAVSMPSGGWLSRSGWSRGMTGGEKWNLWLKSFKTKDDFVKYWISKTYELVSFKKVDFSELLQPMFQKSSYQ